MSTLKHFFEEMTGCKPDTVLVRNNNSEVLFYGPIEYLKLTKWYSGEFFDWNWERFITEHRSELCFTCKYKGERDEKSN